MRDEQNERNCTKCGEKKKSDEFYTKGEKLDSWCKECNKKKRTERYHKKREKLKRFKENRITKVIMTPVENVNQDSMAIIESMLERMIINELRREKR